VSAIASWTPDSAGTDAGLLPEAYQPRRGLTDVEIDGTAIIAHRSPYGRRLFDENDIDDEPMGQVDLGAGAPFVVASNSLDAFGQTAIASPEDVQVGKRATRARPGWWGTRAHSPQQLASIRERLAVPEPRRG
jgi:hypothetical protein